MGLGALRSAAERRAFSRAANLALSAASCESKDACTGRGRGPSDAGCDTHWTWGAGARAALLPHRGQRQRSSRGRAEAQSDRATTQVARKEKRDETTVNSTAPAQFLRMRRRKALQTRGQRRG